MRRLPLPVRLRISPVAAAPVLLAPAAIAFSSGGYFDEARLWAAAAAVAAGRRGWPSRRASASTPGARRRGSRSPALAALTVLDGALAAVGAGGGPGRRRPAAGAAVPRRAGRRRAAAAGRSRRPRRPSPRCWPAASLVAVYALSERLRARHRPVRALAARRRPAQPAAHLLERARRVVRRSGSSSPRACARTPRRPRALRMPPPRPRRALGLALYLTFSRGALGSAALGLVALVALSPDLRTLRAARSPCRRRGAARARDRRAPGRRAHRRGRPARASPCSPCSRPRRPPPRPPRRAGPARARGGSCCAASRSRRPRRRSSAVFAAASVERSPAPEGATAGRYASAQSNRYAYWEVAVRRLRRPSGAGHGLRRLRRRVAARAHDRRERARRALALPRDRDRAGPRRARCCWRCSWPAPAASRPGRARRPARVAALVAYALHAGLDWDWEMPAADPAGRSSCWRSLAASARREAEAQQQHHRRDAVAPRDLLALLVGAAVVGDRDLVQAHVAAAQELGGDLGLDPEAVGSSSSIERTRSVRNAL